MWGITVGQTLPTTAKPGPLPHLVFAQIPVQSAAGLSDMSRWVEPAAWVAHSGKRPLTTTNFCVLYTLI
jgi:hypothetical protein